MKRIDLDQIEGTEVLAKDIVNDSGVTLIVAGTVLKKEYIHKLKNLNIDSVYIQLSSNNLDHLCAIEETAEIRIKNACKQKVKETIEMYASYGMEQLNYFVTIAEQVISEVLEEPEIVYNICGIREQSEDIYTHCVNVCALSVLIGVRMRFSKDKLKEIAIGALMHDIGVTYYAVGTNLRDLDLDSEMNDDTNVEFKKHVIYGYTIVSIEPWVSSTVKDIVLSHHERLNGSGYPRGISGKKIRKATRIVSVCDTFDRLVFGAMGKKYKVYEAIDYIVSKAEVLFDLSVVKVFLDTVAAYPNGSIVITNRAQRAVVVRQNKSCPTRPVIGILKKTNNTLYIESEINLIQDLTLFIVDSE